MVGECCSGWPLICVVDVPPSGVLSLAVGGRAVCLGASRVGVRSALIVGLVNDETEIAIC